MLCTILRPFIMNLCVTGEWLTNKIDEVKESKFFTVVADEVADVSNTEQISIVVRYVDNVKSRKNLSSSSPVRVVPLEKLYQKISCLFCENMD